MKGLLKRLFWLDITINGYPNENIWESSAADFFNMPSGNGASVRVLADKKYVYVNAYVNDITVSDNDTFSVTVSGIGGSHSIKINRSGTKLSGSGTYAVDKGSTSSFNAEFRFPANITDPGKVTAKLIVSDNGAIASGQATLNLTVPATAPTTTTTTTKAPEKPNTPTTRPSGGNNSITIGGNSGGTGGNNNTGGSVTPPVGGATTLVKP